MSFGQKGASALYETVNGISFKNWFTGMGIGIDNYSYNSYPVFFDIRGFFGGHNQWFGYGDLGYNFNAKNKPGKEIYYYNSYDFTGGIYSDVGLGYRFRFIQKSFFTFSGGFTYKEITNKVGIVDPCLVAPCPVDYSNYKYGNGRVVLKAGVDF